MVFLDFQDFFDILLYENLIKFYLEREPLWNPD